MANQRAVGKKLIGAQASAELWAAVDEWLHKNPRATVTDFVLSACLDKLKHEKIPVDVDAVLSDRRARVPAKVSYSIKPSHFNLNEPAKKSASR